MLPKFGAGVAYSKETTTKAALQACQREVHGPSYTSKEWLDAAVHAAYPFASPAERSAYVAELRLRCSKEQPELLRELLDADPDAKNEHQEGCKGRDSSRP